MNNFLAGLGGRKFVVALLGIIAVIVATKTGIEIKPEILEKLVTAIGAITGAYVVSQGVADGLSGGATSSVVQAKKETDANSSKDVG